MIAKALPASEGMTPRAVEKWQGDESFALHCF